MSIVSIEDAAAQCHIDADDADSMALLQLFVDAITTPVEDYLKEVVAQREITEDLDLCGRDRFWLTSKPVLELTSLERIDGSASYDVDQLLTRPSGLVRAISGLRPTGACTATYEAGYDPVPGNIQRAGLIAIQDVWETLRGTAGVSTGVSDEGDYRRTMDHLLVRRVRELLGTPTTLAR